MYKAARNSSDRSWIKARESTWENHLISGRRNDSGGRLLVSSNTEDVFHLWVCGTIRYGKLCLNFNSVNFIKFFLR